MSQTKIFKQAERLDKLPPYLFIEIDNMKKKAIDSGVDIINLGVGDPDIPTPEIIRESLKKAVEIADNHQYPLGKGKSVFRQRIAEFMNNRFGVELDIDDEIQPLIGSKEGLAHFPLAFSGPGDYVLVPEPAYPVYNAATVFAGAEPYFFSLRKENGFMPDWSEIPEDIAEKARMLFINYPNNPTGAMASREFFEKTVAFASKYNIIVCHDAAYSEMYFGGKPISFLELDGAKELSIEFHSLSKPFSMTGWRVGWACGGRELVTGLATVKNNIDSGVFGALQDAGTAALDNYESLCSRSIEVYKERAGLFSAGLREMGWLCDPVRATFYVWTRPPKAVSSVDAVKIILEKAGIVCTPGSGFGPSGEGFVRFALTKDIARLEEALNRLRKISWEI